MGEPPVKEQAEREADKAKPKTEEEQKAKEVKEEIKLDTPEPAKVKPPKPEVKAKATTELKAPVPSKKSNALKFGAVAGVIVLLIVGIWLWVSRQQVNEVRKELEKLDRQALNLENAIAEVDNQEQLKELFRQRDILSREVEGFSENATKLGLESKLEELQNFLRKVQIQLSIKEEELNPPLKTFKNSIGMEFMLIPAGSFTMGSPSDDPKSYENEKQHEVTISKAFYLQTTEVTQGQWKKVMGNNPSKFKECADDCPVEQVSWDDAQKFIEKLNQLEGTNKYRLPTEAEWEYACRAGTTTRFFTGECISTDQANYNGNYPGRNCPIGEHRGKTVKVGSFLPNAWGLYDMHGNVLEWCQDWYGNYPSGSVTDPKGPDKGDSRVVRGGSWSRFASDCRSARRGRSWPVNRVNVFGFRLTRSVALGS